MAVLKEGALRLAFEQFKTKANDPQFQEFITANAAWLDDYVFYQALKDNHGGLPWYEWEPELVARDPSACARWREQLADGIRYHEFVQYVFDMQWRELRASCQEKGIMLIGDLPIFVAHDSADVWARPELFYLDKRGQPLVVAGVPPDYFSATGQLWGNPLYRWEAHAAEDYSWWVARLARLAASRRPRPDRPFSGFRSVLGDTRRLGDRGNRPLGSRPGSQILRGDPQEVGLTPLDRRRPGVDHARRRSASR